MQIDLQEPMKIDSAFYQQQLLPMERDGDVYYLIIKEDLPLHSLQKITLYFSGKPKVARNPPWDGGWIWAEDENKNPFISVACQGKGASVWYPNKDHQSDEVDSAQLTIISPEGLVGVGNGRLNAFWQDTEGKQHTRWVVTNPINNYNIIPYIGKYVNFTESFEGEKGILDCSYWVLDYNLEKAKTHFTQVIPLLQCFEYWFGPYPFYEDSYKLVESPHVGMEHQSAVAYGNKYFNGYRGADISGSGWGMKFDFIIAHETGHEWFGNNITAKDIADMWIHEAFTSYSETFNTECLFGKAAGEKYVQGTRKKILNNRPIIGSYGVQNAGSGDMYYKGANMVHTIRHILNNDTKFRLILREMNQLYRHQTVTTADVEAFLIRATNLSLAPVFDQYLRTIQIPVLEYNIIGRQLRYRWSNVVPGFNMPLKVTLDKERWLKPTTEWQSIKDLPTNNLKLEADPNFYIHLKKTI